MVSVAFLPDSYLYLTKEDISVKVKFPAFQVKT